MRREKLLLNEEINRLKVLMESGYEGQDLIVVDIQPEYESVFGFKIYDFTEFLNENYTSFNSIVLLYNGAETMGMCEEGEYKYWLVENGLNEEVLDYIQFYDKGYAFFRYCIDNGIDEESIVNLVKFMSHNNITDSKDIDEDMWVEFSQQYGDKDVQELLEHAEECLSVPDLMDYLSPHRNILLCGGGVYECLKEVEIALQALDKPYRTYNQFIY